MFPSYEYIKDNAVKYTDWVGGMFMLFNSKTTKSRGFDEKYFYTLKM